MQQSLFTKYFTICITITLAAITVLGAIFMTLSGQYVKDDKYELLGRNLNQAAAVTIADYKLNNYAGITQSTIAPIYSVLGNAIDGDIYLTDLEGNTLICSHNTEECVHTKKNVDSEIIAEAVGGTFKETGTMGGIYSTKFYSAAVPITADGQVVGLLFGSISAEGSFQFVMEMF